MVLGPGHETAENHDDFLDHAQTHFGTPIFDSACRDLLFGALVCKCSPSRCRSVEPLRPSRSNPFPISELTAPSVVPRRSLSDDGFNGGRVSEVCRSLSYVLKSPVPPPPPRTHGPALSQTPAPSRRLCKLEMALRQGATLFKQANRKRASMNV